MIDKELILPEQNTENAENTSSFDRQTDDEGKRNHGFQIITWDMR